MVPNKSIVPKYVAIEIVIYLVIHVTDEKHQQNRVAILYLTHKD